MRLALDTSTLTCSIALVDGDRVLEHFVEGPPTRQSELLPGAIAPLLTRHGVSLAQLDGFVAGLGPGSFTGLRIGLSVMKALGYALKKPVAGASSLAAVAMEGPRGATLFACAMVKKGEVYLGRYRRDGDGVVLLSPETSMTVAALAEALAAQADARMLGPAVEVVRDALLALGTAPGQLLEAPRFPSAVAVAKLAVLPAAYDAQQVFSLEPHYLRGSGAEENPKFPKAPGPEPTARRKEG